MKPFDFINDINTGKKNLMRGTENDAMAEKGYSGFLTNRSLSYFNDTVALANEMNQRHQIDNIMQYEFFLNTVRPKKRFAKWAKKDSHGNLVMVKEYFGYSDSKALQALSILSEQDLDIIKQKMEKGGKNA
jgi:hypothetical protein